MLKFVINLVFQKAIESSNFFRVIRKDNIVFGSFEYDMQIIYYNFALYII